MIELITIDSNGNINVKINKDENNNNNNIKEYLDFKDCTFLITFYKDSEDRHINIYKSLSYLTKIVNSTFYIKELGQCRSFYYDDLLNNSNVIYEFEKKEFIKTELINNMVNNINTKFFIIYDTDILISKFQLNELFKFKNENIYDIIIPYNGLYNEVPRNLIDDLIYSKSFELNSKEIKSRFLKEEYVGTGAVTFFNKESFVKSGMMNENFKKWGREDDEIVYRMFRMGYNILRLNHTGPIHHISHEYKKDGFGLNDHSNIYAKEQKKEYEKILTMELYDLYKYVKTMNK